MKIFTSLTEVYECYGKENIVPLTSLPQVIFYIKNFSLQPKWIDESDRNQGHIVFYFHKGETKKAYSEWMKNRPVKVGI